MADSRENNDELQKSSHSGTEADQAGIFDEYAGQESADNVRQETEETPKTVKNIAEGISRKINSDEFNGELPGENPPKEQSESRFDLPDADAALHKDEEEKSVGKNENKEEVDQPRGCLRALIYTAIILCISVLISIMVISGFNDMMGISKKNMPMDVVIPQGANSAQIAGILKADNIIQNDFVFRLYCKVNHISGLQFGTFSLNSNMTYEQIIEALKESDNNRSTVNVTIPEGYTLQNIAETLDSDGICSKADFLDAVEKQTYAFRSAGGIPADGKRFYKLEGYLFPDTYNFYKKEAPKSVVQTFLNNFNAKFTDALSQKAKSMNMTTDQVITLASIIEKEANNKDEMPRVSAVFHNRLEKGVEGAADRKFLESDATLFYITRTIQPVLKLTDTQLNSPYNTYKYQGLPPGPICNPGMDSINAALNPSKDSVYGGNYYFVTDKDGNYYYAKTKAQHLKNVARALSTGSANGTNVTTK